jgi:hypothetical protein
MISLEPEYFFNNFRKQIPTSFKADKKETKGQRTSVQKKCGQKSAKRIAGFLVG